MLSGQMWPHFRQILIGNTVHSTKKQYMNPTRGYGTGKRGESLIWVGVLKVYSKPMGRNWKIVFQFTESGKIPFQNSCPGPEPFKSSWLWKRYQASSQGKPGGQVEGKRGKGGWLSTPWQCDITTTKRRQLGAKTLSNRVLDNGGGPI